MLPYFRNHNNFKLEVLLWTAFGLACMLALAGCGPREITAAGSEDEALEVLTAALDAWKSGQKPDALRQENPPMYVRDFDWSEGRSLKEFKPHDAPKEHGGEWRVMALLTLTGAGKPDEQTLVAYSVTTDDKAIVITRSDNLD
jgi:hypothetical protein